MGVNDEVYEVQNHMIPLRPGVEYKLQEGDIVHVGSGYIRLERPEETSSPLQQPAGFVSLEPDQRMILTHNGPFNVPSPNEALLATRILDEDLPHPLPFRLFFLVVLLSASIVVLGSELWSYGDVHLFNGVAQMSDALQRWIQIMT